jgi:hypothetical protein
MNDELLEESLNHKPCDCSCDGSMCGECATTFPCLPARLAKALRAEHLYKNEAEFNAQNATEACVWLESKADQFRNLAVDLVARATQEAGEKPQWVTDVLHGREMK